MEGVIVQSLSLLAPLRLQPTTLYSPLVQVRVSRPVKSFQKKATACYREENT